MRLPGASQVRPPAPPEPDRALLRCCEKIPQLSMQKPGLYASPQEPESDASEDPDQELQHIHSGEELLELRLLRPALLLPGFDQTFALDIQKLQRRFLELQRSLHPDNFSRKSPTEQGYSEKQSALVNKAFRTLQKPVTRAVYMVSEPAGC
ncbi:hypothetical protein NFI96_012934 [Prochilodus magdalenae]|nr:hypothetical protein NFI96_012934 [Prochilodus magdalenae]